MLVAGLCPPIPLTGPKVSVLTSGRMPNADDGRSACGPGRVLRRLVSVTGYGAFFLGKGLLNFGGPSSSGYGAAEAARGWTG